MMGPAHRLVGFAAGAGVAAHAGHGGPMVLAAGLVAAGTAHGWSSPDVDQTGPWVATIGQLPGGQHRGWISHGLMFPLLVWWWAGGLAWAGHPGVLTGTVAVLWLALLVGWSSHIVADIVFGERPVVLLPGVRFGLCWWSADGAMARGAGWAAGVAGAWMVASSMGATTLAGHALSLAGG